jgi:hypothetical protein
MIPCEMKRYGTPFGLIVKNVELNWVFVAYF